METVEFSDQEFIMTLKWERKLTLYRNAWCWFKQSSGGGKRKTNKTSEDRSLYQKFKLQKVKRNYNDLDSIHWDTQDYSQKGNIEHGNMN